jgi:hypothetical protein
VTAIEGTSPAFIRELMRRAALVAAEASDGELRVRDAEVYTALEELRRSGALTATLLGAQAPSAPPPGFTGGFTAYPGAAPG